jgi:signal peptidase I
MRRFSPSRESFELIFIVILVGVLARVFLVAPFEATSVAMAPQVLPGDFLMATRVTFGLPLPFSSAKVGGRAPRRGEVVVFKSPESENLRYMNRVVGLPGDRVEMKDNVLMINGIAGEYSLPSEPVSTAENIRQIEQFPWWRIEIFVPAGSLQSFGPVVVPPGHIFVLGDYRSRSYDSRYWGFVPQKHLEAKARWIFWSVEGPKSFKRLPKIRWDRVLSKIE